MERVSFFFKWAVRNISSSAVCLSMFISSSHAEAVLCAGRLCSSSLCLASAFHLAGWSSVALLKAQSFSDLSFLLWVLLSAFLSCWTLPINRLIPLHNWERRKVHSSFPCPFSGWAAACCWLGVCPCEDGEWDSVLLAFSSEACRDLQGLWKANHFFILHPFTTYLPF